MIHGGSPDIYDSGKYPKYYRDYEADPITDLEAVVAACLRAHVFHGDLKQHSDPHAEAIQALVAEGRLSGRSGGTGILDSNVEDHQ